MELIVNDSQALKDFATFDETIVSAVAFDQVSQATAETEAEAPFLKKILELKQTLALPEAGWQVDLAKTEDNFWLRFMLPEVLLPAQGWKLHVSAFSWSALAVLTQVLPYLLTHRLNFKLTRSLKNLNQLNSGESKTSQIGKFITIYPENDSQAVTIAHQLAQLTQGLHGPKIPSDQPLYPGSLVHYRYGGFQGSTFIQNPIGKLEAALQKPDGELVPDVRATRYFEPDWVTNPFGNTVPTQPVHAQRKLGTDYLLFSILYNSYRSIVYLGLDIAANRSCVIKQFQFHSEISKSRSDAETRVNHEVNVLRRLSAETATCFGCPSPFPQVYTVVEQDTSFFIVMEDLGETSLAAAVPELFSAGLLTEERIISWGSELAGILGKLHSLGLVYRDLKTTNILVDPAQHLKLIDFELAEPVGTNNRKFGSGTLGYMSPQLRADESFSLTDDIYGLGAILYFMATCAEPSLAPDPQNLLSRPLELLNNSLSNGLTRIIQKCLAPLAQDRFQTTDEVLVALSHLRPVVETPLDAAFESLPAEPAQPGGRLTEAELANRQAHYKHLADRLATTICHVATAAPNNVGLYWQTRHSAMDFPIARDLNAGSSGTLLALTELATVLNKTHYKSVVEQAAIALARPLPQLRGQLVAGLYVGEGGRGLALLRAGQLLGDAGLVQTALDIATSIHQLPYTSPDLFNGTAGRLRYHAWLWLATKQPEQLKYALAAGNHLLQTARTDEKGHLFWEMPAGYGTMSGQTHAGYAHGTAGIADALLDLYEISLDERFLEAAQQAGYWLLSKSISVYAGRGLDWSQTENTSPSGGIWCYGAAGVGRFFLHASQLNCFADVPAREIALKAAYTLTKTHHISPVQCHGLAGNIEYLVDVYQVTKNQFYLEEALLQAEVLETFGIERAGHLYYRSESPQVITPDYMVGYAGIATCFLRLSEAANFPNILGIENFKTKTNTLTAGGA